MNKVINSIVHSLYFRATDNFAFSPASYMAALLNVAAASSGKNLSEILDLLEMSEEQFLDYLKTFESHFSEIERYNCFLFSPEYLAALKPDCQFLPSTNFLPFEENVISQVNDIVDEKTHGKIKSFISKDDIDSLTKFIILNCLYMKKDWLNPFNNETQEESFFGTKNESKVKYLYDQRPLRYHEDESVDIVEIPYKDSSLSCFIFVPKHSLFEIIDSFSSTYSKINKVFYHDGIDVNIEVPSFKTESTLELNDATKIAGIKNIFDWSKDWKFIDFSKLDPEALIKVQKIIQKTYIDFTKDGVEASAATGFFMAITGCCMSSQPWEVKRIIANKPFLYVIVDRNKTEMPLFIGVVHDV